MNANQTLIATSFSLLLAVAALSGCMSATASTGTAAIFVKDAPADQFSHVYVSFTKVEVHQVLHANATAGQEDESGEASQASESEGNETEDGAHARPADDARDHEVEADQDHGEHDGQDRAEGQWLTIVERNATVDLKAFTGNASSFLGDAAIPAGDYNGIRITVTSASATIAANGTTVPVKVPSGALRIKGHFTVVAGKETDLTLDFNLARSVVETGHGTYILKPVLRLASAERDEAGDQERHAREGRRDDDDKKFRDVRDGHDGPHGHGDS